ncbi:ParB/RepB/Spo0J family partition protein [Paraburkholderia sp. WP4_3_2]|uniref:ParB/RepB/Spo0J family partition protein n=1 Tax=Paraburkholderia sp. WP4_3_2 TaxID=2587162 RepID=UPI0016117CE6|nr:ParB/RepB/Spo0J family partition protein [Paraburkholderia sp. WP4_3_2]MBB3261276.1 ParB/RepB/Spo0J family partition protein [Paraburkholderia sp. WP4_3_2]
MRKSTSEKEFLANLTARTDGQPASRMKLTLPPTGGRRSLDEMLRGEEKVEQASTPQPQSSGPFESAINTGRWISVDVLDTHPWNARVHRSPERIRQIANEIAATRQHSPILITPNPAKPERFFVVDGETRFRAVKSLNRKEIWVLEVPVDPNDALEFYVESFKQTDATEKISPIDQGIKWGELVEQKHATADAIAERLELSPSTVSRMLSYRRYPARVLEFMHAHADRFPYSIAAALAPVLDTGIDEDKLLALCQKIVDEEYSRRAIEAMVKSAVPVERATRRSALISRAVKRGPKQVGSFRTYESGALEFKLSAAHGLSDESVHMLEKLLDVATDILSSSESIELLPELQRRLLGSEQ